MAAYEGSTAAQETNHGASQNDTNSTDQRLIEAGFPCHQVGAETQRERGASSALPPLYYLHVWWARRPLTPSRAAILGSLLPADAGAEEFVKALGIRRYQACVGDQFWTLTSDKLLRRVEKHDGTSVLPVDETVQQAFEAEVERRKKCQDKIRLLRQADVELATHPALHIWERDTQPLKCGVPTLDSQLQVIETAADPAGVKDKIEFAKLKRVADILGEPLRFDDEDSYGYKRAFANSTENLAATESKTVLDPTSGGGSIPFEALRLGHSVIANELNPVAGVILHATLDYPARFGPELAEDIKRWGTQICRSVENQMALYTPFSAIPKGEIEQLKSKLGSAP